MQCHSIQKPRFDQCFHVVVHMVCVRGCLKEHALFFKVEPTPCVQCVHS